MGIPHPGRNSHCHNEFLSDVQSVPPVVADRQGNSDDLG